MSRLFVVGTGPGATDLLTPRATKAIQASTDLVAYGLYLDLLGDLCAGKQHHDLPLGEEIARARLALDLAAPGRAHLPEHPLLPRRGLLGRPVMSHAADEPRMNRWRALPVTSSNALSSAAPLTLLKPPDLDPVAAVANAMVSSPISTLALSSQSTLSVLRLRFASIGVAIESSSDLPMSSWDAAVE